MAGHPFSVRPPSALFDNAHACAFFCDGIIGSRGLQAILSSDSERSSVCHCAPSAPSLTSGEEEAMGD